MSQKTRDRIIAAAKPLFNEEGYGAPTLYQLSQELGISRGNLTYYFKDKRALLQTIVEEMWRMYETLMSRTTRHPSWESTNNSTLEFHALQNEYAFIFFDRHLLNVPQIKDQIKRIREHHMEWQRSIVHFAIQIGNMKKELVPGTYDNLFKTIWTMSFFWQMSSFYKDNPAEKDWSRYVWGIILPHFTDKGRKSFIDHFGATFYNQLGTSFDDFKVNAFAL